MKGIVIYCKKDGKKTKATITEIEAPLKLQVKKDDYAEIQNTIKFNKIATKQIQHQRTLKHKPNPTVKTTNFTEGNNLLEKSPTPERSTYIERLRATKNPSIRTNKTNLNSYKTNKKKIQEKSRSLRLTV